MCLAGSLPVLYAGRLVYEMGIGFAMHAAPAYIAETSPARIRGFLIFERGVHSGGDSVGVWCVVC